MAFVRHCPRCQSDYQAHVSQCADCGGALEDRFEGMEPAAESAPVELPATLPPGEYETLYFSHSLADLGPLGERLDQRGIPFRIDSLSLGSRHQARYELLVRGLERETAREELLYLLGGGIEQDQARTLDRDFDPACGYRRCPGCSSGLASGTVECPECGLVLLEPEDPAES